MSVNLNLYKSLPASLDFRFGIEVPVTFAVLDGVLPAPTLTASGEVEVPVMGPMAVTIGAPSAAVIGAVGAAGAVTGAVRAVWGSVGRQGETGLLSAQPLPPTFEAEGDSSLYYTGVLDADSSAVPQWAAFFGPAGVFAADASAIAHFIGAVGAAGFLDGLAPALAALLGRQGAQGTAPVLARSVLTGSGRGGVQGDSAVQLPPFGGMEAEGEWDANAPRGPSPSVWARFPAPTPLRPQTGAVWQYAYKRRPDVVDGWEDAAKASAEVGAGFTGLTRGPLEQGIPFAEGSPLRNIAAASYVGAYRAHQYRRTVWVDAEVVERPVFRSPWLVLWKRRSVPRLPWQDAQRRHRAWQHRWQIPYPGGRPCWPIKWQDGRVPPWVWPWPIPVPVPEPEPPFRGVPNLDLKCALPVPIWGPVGFALDETQCRSAYHIGFEPIPWLGRFIMLVHQLEVRLLSNNQIIPCEYIDIKADRSSWCWGWSASALGEYSALAHNQETVLLRVDDWYWKGLVEQARARKVFGLVGVQIGGRSLSAQLAEPYSSRRSRLEENERTAVQLVEDELYQTGWEVDWDTVDWLVPGGVFSYDALTPMEAITRIAGAVGAFVLTHPTDLVLQVKPFYARPTWDVIGHHEVTIPADLILEMSIEWKPVPLFRGVWVSGKTSGVLAKVLREGTDGAPYKQMVVDDLITHVDAARERGTQELCAGGRRSLVTITLPVTATTGVLLPGQIVRVQANPDFYGFVDSVSIRAARPAVQQTVVVERVHETP